MNSKDYTLIAKSIAQNVEAVKLKLEIAEAAKNEKNIKSFNQQYMGIYQVAHNMASRLQAYRQGFDKNLFLKECGL